MPYNLVKASPNGFFVETKGTGRKHSKMPMPKERAMRQMRALYMSMPGEARMMPEGRPMRLRMMDKDRR